jgi:putative ABC transport system substrate-binding protein
MSLGTAGASDPFMDAFRKGMLELGYVEGQNFLMEPRYGAAKFELMVEQAAELERAGVDVIIAGPFDALRAAKQSTSRVPIIMMPSADPVVTGIVASLDRPGGTNDLHIPAIYEWRSFVQQGGLISYGADVLDIYRRAASLVDKILKGTRPADLPVEKATKVEMSVNIKSAQALGLTIPDAIVRQAVTVF